VAVLDSDVLFGYLSTDLLISFSVAGHFQARWSRKILEDAQRNILLHRRHIDPQRLQSRMDAMLRALPDALVEPPQELIDSMPIGPSDAHVLAAAVFSGSRFVVTNNVRDFPAALCSPLGARTQCRRFHVIADSCATVGLF
jgi:PIN domain